MKRVVSLVTLLVVGFLSFAQDFTTIIHKDSSKELIAGYSGEGYSVVTDKNAKRAALSAIEGDIVWIVVVKPQNQVFLMMMDEVKRRLWSLSAFEKKLMWAGITPGIVEVYRYLVPAYLVTPSGTVPCSVAATDSLYNFDEDYCALSFRLPELTSQVTAVLNSDKQIIWTASSVSYTDEQKAYYLDLYNKL